jgi:putative transposase
VFIERLWRSVKYEEVYLRDYADGWEAERSLAGYFECLGSAGNGISGVRG